MMTARDNCATGAADGGGRYIRTARGDDRLIIIAAILLLACASRGPTEQVVLPRLCRGPSSRQPQRRSHLTSTTVVASRAHALRRAALINRLVIPTMPPPLLPARRRPRSASSPARAWRTSVVSSPRAQRPPTPAAPSSSPPAHPPHSPPTRAP